MSYEVYNQGMDELYTCIRPKSRVPYTFNGEGNLRAKRLFLTGENTIPFTCTSDYRDAAGYVLKEWGFITEQDENEVISFDGMTALVQGRGKADFILCQRGECRRITVDFTRQPVQEVTA